MFAIFCSVFGLLVRATHTPATQAGERKQIKSSLENSQHGRHGQQFYSGTLLIWGRLDIWHKFFNTRILSAPALEYFCNFLQCFPSACPWDTHPCHSGLRGKQIKSSLENSQHGMVSSSPPVCFLYGQIWYLTKVFHHPNSDAKNTAFSFQRYLPFWLKSPDNCPKTN